MDDYLPPTTSRAAPPSRYGGDLPEDINDRFLALLEEHGSVSWACSCLGLPRPTVYARRDRDPDFAEAWAAALARWRERLAERVMLTAEQLGTGEWVEVLDGNGDLVLDDGLEPVLRFDTSQVDVRMAIKLLEKHMEDPVRRVDQRTVYGSSDAVEVRIVNPDGTDYDPAAADEEWDPLDA